MFLDSFFKHATHSKTAGSDAFSTSEKPLRSIVKSISWRVLGTLDTIIISWIITGKVSLALSIGLVEIVTKMLLYFFHERIWNMIQWGKQ